jgi:hypothetical protein
MILNADLRVKNFLGYANVIQDFLRQSKDIVLMSHVVVMINLKVKNGKAIKQTGFYPSQSH